MTITVSVLMIACVLGCLAALVMGGSALVGSTMDAGWSWEAIAVTLLVVLVAGGVTFGFSYVFLLGLAAIF